MMFAAMRGVGLLLLANVPEVHRCFFRHHKLYQERTTVNLPPSFLFLIVFVFRAMCSSWHR
jgi:drug/metabolite transporter superfamily protein YnfA